MSAQITRGIVISSFTIVVTSFPVDVVGASFKPALVISKGPAKKAGTIQVELTWKSGNRMKTRTIDVSIAQGDTREQIRDKIKDALNADDIINDDWSFVAESEPPFIGTYQIAAGERRDTNVFATEVSIKNSDQIGGFSWAGAMDPPPEIFGTFDLFGELAGTHDSFQVWMSQFPAPQPREVDVFELTSYDGLSPDEVEEALASLIDAHISYEAELFDLGGGVNEVLILGLDPEFGVHLFSDNLLVDTPALSGEAGVRLPEFPAPTLFVEQIGIDPNGCCIFAYSIENRNPNQPAGDLFLHIQAGDGHVADDECAMLPLLPADHGYTSVTYCYGPDVEGRSVISLTGGMLQIGESANGQLALRVHPGPDPDPIPGSTDVVPVMGVRVHAAQDRDETDPQGANCAAGTFGPYEERPEGGLWSAAHDWICFKPVPALGSARKTALIVLLAAVGLGIVLRR